jgi:hypothetical protein
MSKLEDPVELVQNWSPMSPLLKLLSHLSWSQGLVLLSVLGAWKLDKEAGLSEDPPQRHILPLASPQQSVFMEHC